MQNIVSRHPANSSVICSTVELIFCNEMNRLPFFLRSLYFSFFIAFELAIVLDEYKHTTRVCVVGSLCICQVDISTECRRILSRLLAIAFYYYCYHHSQSTRTHTQQIALGKQLNVSDYIILNLRKKKSSTEKNCIFNACTHSNNVAHLKWYPTYDEIRSIMKKWLNKFVIHLKNLNQILI